MKLRLPKARQHSLGISLSETQLYATLPAIDGARDRPYELPLSPLGRTDAEWPALTEAFAELRKVLPLSYRSLSIALLPPLVQLRHVELPKLRATELRLVLSRNAARYLPGVHEPHTAHGIALTTTVPVQYLMAGAPMRLIDAIARAAQESGWELATIVPAHSAWTVAAQQEWPVLGRTTGEVVVPVNGHVEVLQLREGGLAGIRRMRREERSERRGGYNLEQPAHSAAAYATTTSAPELLPERIYAQRALSRRRTAIRLAIGVAAVAVLAAVGVLAHARYVLHQVVAQRAALQDGAKKTAKAQREVLALSTPLGALGRIETNAVVWSQVLADLTEVLPADASLASFHAHGDSIAISGTATHGADVFERIGGAKLINDVRPSAPLRREVKADKPPVDRFEFVARIPGVAPLYSVKKPKGKRQ